MCVQAQKCTSLTTSLSAAGTLSTSRLFNFKRLSVNLILAVSKSAAGTLLTSHFLNFKHLSVSLILAVSKSAAGKFLSLHLLKFKRLSVSLILAVSKSAAGTRFLPSNLFERAANVSLLKCTLLSSTDQSAHFYMSCMHTYSRLLTYLGGLTERVGRPEHVALNQAYHYY